MIVEGTVNVVPETDAICGIVPDALRATLLELTTARGMNGLVWPFVDTVGIALAPERNTGVPKVTVPLTVATTA
jgi:hypothetical protein